MAVQKDQPIAPSEPASILSMIQAAASNPNVDMDKMERLWAMHEKAVDRQAAQSFNQSLNAAQGRMGRVQADMTNNQTRSDYASYAALDKALRPIYTDEGFALSFGTAPDAPEGCVRVLCHVSHREGHTRTYQADMPNDGKGAKGGDVMTKTHATGSAMTYGMRYLLKMIFNVAIGEDDDDGNSASDPPPVTRTNPNDGVWQALDSETQVALTKISFTVHDFYEAGDMAGAYDFIQKQGLSTDEKAGLHTLFDSKIRTALKKEHDSRKETK